MWFEFAHMYMCVVSTSLQYVDSCTVVFSSPLYACMHMENIHVPIATIKLWYTVEPPLMDHLSTVDRQVKHYGIQWNLLYNGPSI